jgi:hypothetical protein
MMNLLLTIIITLMLLFTIWLLQSTITIFLNIIFGVRIPLNIKDFLKLTFLPYVVYHLIYDKESLK